jgi:hypothetical protein
MKVFRLSGLDYKLEPGKVLTNQSEYVLVNDKDLLEKKIGKLYGRSTSKSQLEEMLRELHGIDDFFAGS